MAGYQLKITSGGETIELSTKEQQGMADITKLSFKVNTIDRQTRNRSDNVRTEIVLEGVVTKENREKTKGLTKWALDADRTTLYRSVTLVVYEAENCTGDVLRRYQIDNMFVIDYDEFFNAGSNADKGEFTMIIAQRDGSYKKDVFAS